MDTNFALTFLSCGGIFLSRLSRSGRSGLRNGCEVRTLLAWKSRDDHIRRRLEHSIFAI